MDYKTILANPASRLLLGAALLAMSAITPANNGGIEIQHDGPAIGSDEHRMTTMDMQVKVVGGFVQVRRQWIDGGWTFFPRWASLEPSVSGSRLADGFDDLPAGDLPDSIYRGKTVYELDEEEEHSVWRNGPARTITSVDEGYRWQSRSGDWIDYDRNGLMTAYGNRNHEIVSVERDEQGRVARVEDTHGSEVLSVSRDGQGRVVSIEDRAGRSVGYEWNGSLLATVVDVRGGRWDYTYQEITGLTRIVEMEDPDGRYREYEFKEVGGVTECIPTGSGNWQRGSSGTLQWAGSCQYISVPSAAFLYGVLDARGYRSRNYYAYDADRKEYVRASEQSGRSVQRTLNEDGRVTERRIEGDVVERWSYGDDYREYIDANGNTTRTYFNAYNEPVKIVHPDGTTESIEYNEWGEVTKHENTEGVVTRHEYDGSGNRVRTTEAVGTQYTRTTEFEYDELGQMTLRRLQGDANTETSEETMTYDQYGNLVSKIDPEGFEKKYSDFDSLGNPRQWVDKDGYTWKAEYDATGSEISVEDPNGDKSRTEYDASGNVTAREDALGNRDEYKLDEAGFLVELVGPDGNTTKLEYDDQRRVTALRDPDGVTHSREYDDSGRLDRLIGPDGSVRDYTFGGPDTNASERQIVRMEGPVRTVEYKYNSRGHRIAEIEIGHSGERLKTEYDYDSEGRVIAITHPNGRTEEFGYDWLGRNNVIRNNDGTEITLSHDAHDNVTRVRNERGIDLIVHDYDARGLRVSTTNAHGYTESFEYNGRELRSREVDAEGQVTDIGYDEVGRKSDVRLFHSEADYASGESSRETEFTYDAADRLVGFDDGDFEGTYTYDSYGRRTGSTIDVGHFSAGYSFEYSSAGRLEMIVYPDGEGVSYAYDQTGRLEEIEFDDGSVVRHNYSQNGVERVYPGGTRTQWEYDEVGRLGSAESRDPAGNNLSNSSFEYDGAGNIVQMVSEEESTEFSYDQRDRLTAVSVDGEVTEQYDYDQASNRIGSHESDDVWQYSDTNRLTSKGETEFEYNRNGAMIHRDGPSGTVEYEYGPDQRLIGVQLGDGTEVEHAYLHDETRIRRAIDNEATYFLESRYGVLAEMDSSGSVTRKYVWSPHPISGKSTKQPVEVQNDGAVFVVPDVREDDAELQRELIASMDGGERAYYINDHMGAPDMAVDRAGSVRWSGEYDSFGRVEEDNGDFHNPIRMPGQYDDGVGDGYYNHNRYYYPELGRYQRVDPIRYGFNHYNYAEQNPVNNIDPLGLCSVSGGGGVSGKGSAGLGASGSATCGVTLGCSSFTACQYCSTCIGVDYGAGASVAASMETSFSTAQPCSGTSTQTVSACGGAAGVGANASYSQSGTGDCLTREYGLSGTGGLSARASCSVSQCVVNQNCMNEPDCCDESCECGGCG